MTCEAEDLRLMAALERPLPLTARPFAQIADETGIPEDVVIERIQGWLSAGVIRRFGARIALPAGAEATPFLFGEDQGRYLATAAADVALDDCPVPLLRLGTTLAEERLVVEGHADLAADRLRAAHERFFLGLMG